MHAPECAPIFQRTDGWRLKGLLCSSWVQFKNFKSLFWARHAKRVYRVAISLRVATKDAKCNFLPAAYIPNWIFFKRSELDETFCLFAWISSVLKRGQRVRISKNLQTRVHQNLSLYNVHKFRLNPSGETGIIKSLSKDVLNLKGFYSFVVQKSKVSLKRYNFW